jgi:hypothetical protein
MRNRAIIRASSAHGGFHRVAISSTQVDFICPWQISFFAAFLLSIFPNPIDIPQK